MLSILIPTYNTDCLSLIQALYGQCEELKSKDASFVYEIIVADDCSPNKEVVSTLQKGVSELGTESVRLYVLSHNLRHAAVRNFLLKEAKGEWILFIDSDAEVMSPLFIDSYWNHRFKSDIIIGGIAHPTQTPPGHELRLVYERKYAYKRDVTWRRMHPYAIFSVFNIFARASVIRNYGFDESCREYGYEDYLLGVALEQDGIAILEVASRTCAPCIRIRQKIDEWLKNYAAVSAAYLEIESVPEAGGELQIFTAPAVLVYIDGKLCIKQAGYFSLDEVFRQIERYLSLM